MHHFSHSIVNFFFVYLNLQQVLAIVARVTCQFNALRLEHIFDMFLEK